MKSIPSEIAVESFKIIVVDDQRAAIESYLKNIPAYINAKGLDPAVIYDKDGTELEKHLDGDDIDIIATDMNLPGHGGKGGGKRIVESVRETHHSLTDILFYTADIVSPDEMRKNVGYNHPFVEVCRRDDVEEFLKLMIDRNLWRLKDITFLRGVVISKVIDLEWMVNEIVARYFGIPPELDAQFRSFVTENRSYSLEGRIEALKRILHDKKYIKLKKGGNQWDILDPRLKDDVIQKLKNLQNDRNLLAHCTRAKDDPDCLISWGDKVKFPRKKMIEIIADARKAGKMLRILRDEFSFNLVASVKNARK